MTVMKQGDHGEPVPFRKLQHHLRQLTAGGATNALVLQALANMCCEEENIVDQMTLERAEKKEHGKAREQRNLSLQDDLFAVHLLVMIARIPTQQPCSPNT